MRNAGSKQNARTHRFVFGWLVADLTARHRAVPPLKRRYLVPLITADKTLSAQQLCVATARRERRLVCPRRPSQVQKDVASLPLLHVLLELIVRLEDHLVIRI